MAKNRLKIANAHKTAAICALLFLTLLLAGLLVNIVRRGELSARTRALQSEIALLELEKEQNDSLLADLNSKDFADAYAREQLGLKKKDEKLYKGEE